MFKQVKKYEMSNEILKRINDFKKSMDGVEILKSTAAYGYNYADLDSIHKVIDPILRKNLIGIFHKASYSEALNCNKLTTLIYCIDDPEDAVYSETLIDKDATLAKMNKFMVEGSAMTYFRRYHIVTMLGLLADEDTDAGGKRFDSKSKGRSVESNATAESTIDFKAIFTKQAETKTQAQFVKTFDAYKSQMTNEDIEAVTKIMTDKYGN